MDIRGTNLEGASDGTVWAIAQQGERLLVSTDKGFARRRSEEHFGLLIVRLRQPTRTRIHERVLAALPAIEESMWPGTLVMVRDTAKSVWRR
jgi:predicted nuclease of predicted toxin-antitoxin system